MWIMVAPQRSIGRDRRGFIGSNCLNDIDMDSPDASVVKAVADAWNFSG